MSEPQVNFPVLSYENIYDCYPLYFELYSRSNRYKNSEVKAAQHMMRWLADFNSQHGLLDFGASGFNVLEILAGRGDHYHRFPDLKEGEVPRINSYYNLDIREHDGDNCVVGDCTTYKPDPKMNINFIIGFFFTGSTITDKNGVHSRKVLLDMFRNAYESLPEGGGFSIDFSSGGYYTSLSCLEPANNPHYRDIDVDSELSRLCNVPQDSKNVSVTYLRTTRYNRLESTVFDHFEHPFEVWADGVKYAEIHIKTPLTQRYISEPELVDIAMEAGFKTIQLFNCNHPKGPYDTLPMNFTIADPVKDVDALMATNILCVKADPQ